MKDKFNMADGEVKPYIQAKYSQYLKIRRHPPISALKIQIKF